MEHYIGIDMGASSTKGGLVQNNEIVYKTQIKTPVPMNEQMCLETIYALVDKIIAQNNVKIAGIGLGLCGTVMADKGIFYGGINISSSKEGWVMDIVTPIQKRYGVRVKIANDVSCFAIAEARIAKQDNLVYIALGTGINIGVINNGKLFAGTDGVNLEYGHTSYGDKIVDKAISGLGIRASAKRMGLDIAHPHEVFEMYDNNKKAREIVDDFIKALIDISVNIAYSYRPDIIFVGGGLAVPLERFFGEVELGFQMGGVGDKWTDIKLSNIATNGGILGAAFLNM